MKISESNYLCKYCEATEFYLLPKLISSGKPFPHPKYTPQLKEVCAKCKKWARFAPQDEKTIEKINSWLESLIDES